MASTTLGHKKVLTNGVQYKEKKSNRKKKKRERK
jgi:hypothetical protein